jgi:hypothetical protein
VSASNGQRGQAMVEFALILPALLLMMLMAVDAGRLFFGWVNLQNAARIAANYAANYPTASWGTGSAYASQIQADATTINCTLPPTLPAPTFPAGTATLGDPVEVSLTCGFHLFTPLLGNILGNPVELGSSAVFPIRVGIIGGASVTGVVPTPTPTTSPTPTPSATPQLCTVPTFIGQIKANQAPPQWKQAGFTPTNLTVAFGGPNYLIEWETPPNSDGTSQPCDAFTLEVGPGAP